MVDPRQKMIVMQSSMTRAIEILKHNLDGEKITLEDVLTVTDILADHIIENASK